MRTKAILCNAAETLGGRLYLLGGYPAERLYGPRRGVRGAVAGMVFDVPAKRAGERVRIAAQLGTSDHFDGSSWRPARVNGRPVRVERSVLVEAPSGGSRRRVNVPFAFELPTTELG